MDRCFHIPRTGVLLGADVDFLVLSGWLGARYRHVVHQYDFVYVDHPRGVV